ncbi:MAG: Hsp33 family molecular chaperone HslO [Rhizobacter sp.]|nr:Hsp33 family molecular chaperone HslO [Rhizobacter sp.]
MSELQRFLFDRMPVRGLLVRLTNDWREVLQRRPGESAFPPPVRALLGEMAAASVLMQASLRFEGALVLQVFGDGPVKLAVAEVQHDLAFRVTASITGDVAADAQLEAMLNVHGGGRCAITLDPQGRQPGQQPYQGVVPLHGDRREPLQQLSLVLEHYMLQSEQLDTRLVLAANDDIAAGLLIQRMPVSGAGNLGGERNEDRIGLDEDYKRIALLAGTLTDEELLTLPSETLLRRLFWEEPLRRFERQAGESAPRFACNCSRQRVGRMLLGLGAAEVEDIVAEQGRVEIGCEFCGLKYHFDPVDVGGLFTPASAQAPGSAAIN